MLPISHVFRRLNPLTGVMPSRGTLLLALLVVALNAPTAFADGSESDAWPSFRGDQAMGVASGQAVTSWNTETGENVLWKVELPGLAHSSPVIWEDRIYLTTAVAKSGKTADLRVGLYGDIAPVDDEGVQQFQVMALDKATGKVLWTRTAHEGVPAIKRHTKATHANSSPSIDGENLVVFFGSEGLFSYDLEGTLQWKKDFGVLDSGFFRAKTAQWGFASSPLLYDGKVLIQADVQEGSFVGAYDAKTGKELWRTVRDEVPTWSTPAVVPYTAGGKESLQVVLNGWKHIGGYDLETGKELWKLVGGGDIPVPTPLYYDGLIYITSAHGQMRPIYAIRTDAVGEITTDSKAIAWWHEKAGNYMQTPILHDGLAYFCYDNGVFSVFDAKTGERQYQQRLGAGQSGFSGSPVLVGEHIYVTSEDGDTWVLKTGREFNLVAENELGEVFMASPAVSENVLYFRARNHLYALGSD